MENEYVTTNVFHFGSATVIVKRPKALTEEERNKRYERIEEALYEYAKATNHLRNDKGEIVSNGKQQETCAS